MYRELASHDKYIHRRSQAQRKRTLVNIRDTCFVWFCFVPFFFVLSFVKGVECLVVLSNQSSYLSFFPYCYHRVRYVHAHFFIQQYFRLSYFDPPSLYHFSILFLPPLTCFFFVFFFGVLCPYLYKEKTITMCCFSYCLPLINNKPVTLSPWEHLFDRYLENWAATVGHSFSWFYSL